MANETLEKMQEIETERTVGVWGVSRSVVAGVWGSSQTRGWVALPVSRKLPGDAPSSTARRTTSHTGARSAARRPGRGLKPGQSLWVGPQGARRAWWADSCAVLRMVRPAARRTPRPPIRRWVSLT